MIRGVVIVAVLGAASLGIYYYGIPQLDKSPEAQLSQALGNIQSGLTYDKFVNMVGSQRDQIVQKMDPKTINLVLEEAKKVPTTVSESMEDMESKITTGSQTVVYSKQGTFSGMNGNDAKGRAFVISLGSIAFLRFENFEVTNGPDLHVYITKGGDVSTGTDLGQLKGSIGDQNYPLKGVDLKNDDTVVIYSVPFKIYFAQAKLT